MAVGELVVSIIGDMRELSKTFAQVQTEIDGIGKKFQSVGSALKDTGKTMSTYVTAPLVGIGAVSLHTAANFDDSMRKVQAVSGATGSDFEKLTNQARELGATTAFSASDAADAMYYLALAGWDVNEIMDATPGLLSLASAAGMDLGEAADIVSDTMSGFTMNADQAGRTADVFATITSNANTDVHQLGEAMKYASSTANAAGMDIEQTAAVLGVLADSGIKGSMAGTTFNAMLRDMKKNAVDGTIAIGKHTIALYNQDGTMRDLGSIMAEVEKATEGMTDKQRDAALSAIFQEESIRGVNIMLATGSERYQELEVKLRSSEGAAKSMADTMEGGVGGAIREMESALEELMIVLGNIIVVGVTPLIKYITDLANWFSKLPAPIQQTVVAIGAILAVIGPLLVIIGSVASAIGSLATLFGSGGALAAAFAFAKTAIAGIVTALGSFALPVALVIAAVTALALAWKNNWFDIQGKFQAAKTAIETAVRNFSNTLQQLWHGLIMAAGNLRTNLSTIWDTIKTVFSTVGNVIISAVQSMYAGLQSRYNSLIAAGQSLLASWRTHWTNFQTAISTAAGAISSYLGTLYSNIQSRFASIKTAASSILSAWKSHWSSFQSATSAAASTLSSALSSMHSYVQSRFNQIKSAASSILSAWKTHWNNFKSATSSAASSINSALGSMLSYVQSRFNSIKSAAASILSAWKTHWSNFVSATSSAASSISSALSSMLSNMQSRFNSIKSAVLSLLNDWKARWNNIVSATNSAGSQVVNAVKGIASDVKALVSSFSAAGRAIMDALYDSITSGFSKAIKKAKDSLKELKSYLPSSPAEKGPFRVLPNWDAAFSDPIEASIKKVRSMSGDLRSALSGLRSPIDSSLSAGFSRISNITNSSTTYGGDTISIGPNTISNGIDLQAIIAEIERQTANKRRARGLYK